MLVLKKLNYHNILQFLKEKWNTYLNETCQPYKSGNAKTQKRTPQKKAKERQKTTGPPKTGQKNRTKKHIVLRRLYPVSKQKSQFKKPKAKKPKAKKQLARRPNLRRLYVFSVLFSIMLLCFIFILLDNFIGL